MLLVATLQPNTLQLMTPIRKRVHTRPVNSHQPLNRIDLKVNAAGAANSLTETSSGSVYLVVCLTLHGVHLSVDSYPLSLKADEIIICEHCEKDSKSIQKVAGHYISHLIVRLSSCQPIEVPLASYTPPTTLQIPRPWIDPAELTTQQEAMLIPFTEQLQKHQADLKSQLATNLALHRSITVATVFLGFIAVMGWLVTRKS